MTITIFRIANKVWYTFAVLLAMHGMISTSSFGSAFCVAVATAGTSTPGSRNARDNRDISHVVRASALQAPLPQIRNVYDRFSFGWVKGLMKKGNAKPVEFNDLWQLQEQRRMQELSQSFEDRFQEEKRKQYRKPTTVQNMHILSEFWRSPITRAIVYMYKRDLANTGLLKLLNTMIQFAPALFISRILKFVGSNQGGKALTPITLPAVFAGLSPPVRRVLVHLVHLLRNEGVQLSLLLFVTLCAKTAVENQYFHSISQMSSEIRGTLSTAVYRKSLKLSPSSRKDNTMGEIVNYMQLDTNRLEHVAHSIHTVWDGALQITGYTLLLLQFLGPSVFAGIAAMLVILPLNAYFLRNISRLREANLKFTDKRVKLTNELLLGIRAIKSYNWEAPFAEQLQAIRELELKGLKSAANMRSLLVCALSTAPSLVAVCTLSTYALLGNDLTPTKVFTSLALFNQLRYPLIFFPMLVNTLAEGKVSLRRLNGFLLAPEVQNYVRSEEEEGADRRLARDTIRITNGSFAWSEGCLPEKSRSFIGNVTCAEGSTTNTAACVPGEDRDKLLDVNFSVRRGQLVAVVGPTGSGKSTLLSALLGELNKLEGEVLVKGKVAYVPQSSWIPNDSLRNVILFGSPMDWDRYHKVIKICGLEKDLELLEAGDLTEIGERGVNLSGGQKQRVSMARAVYQNADVYLLDDPLSALDNEVGAKLFAECIKKGLAGKTRVLVTHHLDVLAQVDRIFLMDHTEDGSACRILDQGPLRALVRRGHDLSRYVNNAMEPAEDKVGAESVIAQEGAHLSHSTHSTQLAHNVTASGCDTSFLEGVPPLGGPVDISATIAVPSAEVVAVESESATTEVTLPVDETGLPRTVEPSANTPGSALSPENSPALASADSAAPSKKCPVRLMSKEERAEGAVGSHVYRAYIVAANKPLLLALLAASVLLGNASLVLQQWVVAAWTGDAGYAKRPLSVYLSGVTLMAALVGLFSYLRTYFGVLIGAAASKTIHRQMITRVMKAPLNFFESTPVGRLVQRFSKDLDQIDQQLPSSIGQLISSTFSIASSMFAIAAVTPSFSLAMAAIFSVYFSVTNYYRKVARELKRLEAISRSPIYSHFSETLGGLPVIRSYKRQTAYLRNNEVRLDDNISTYNILKAVDRWLCVRLEVLGNAIVLFSALLAVLTGSKAGSAGLSLNNALGVTSLLNWAVRNAAETEALMNSVERVSYTINETPQEAPREVRQIGTSALPLGIDFYQQFIPPPFPHDSETSPAGSSSSASSTTAEPAVASHSNQDPRSAQPSEPVLTEDELLRSGWPWKGALTFSNAHMRYRTDFEEVLKGVDMHILPGERIGIVGRTGSGKSSLFRGLLRLTELEGGRILIDGVDSAQIGLNALRSSMSIIPQDPVLFCGTIRMNLDPFNTHTDAELWAALRKAKLDRTVISLPGALLYEVSEGGDNFSLGQRQLLCLARALVRRSRILLLDEATSSVDYDTDALIQQTIRREFGDGATTVLTIAHRLESVLDADRIVLMDAGRVGEFGTPAELLADPASLFSQLLMAESNQRDAYAEDLFL